MNFSNGILHEAQWINQGPSPVNFGLTSDDEMMVLVMMYLTDTTGVDITTSTQGPELELANIQVFPNPAWDQVSFGVPISSGSYRLSLFDALGRPVFQQQGIRQPLVKIQRHDLPAGIYYYRIETEDGRQGNGKLIYN